MDAGLQQAIAESRDYATLFWFSFVAAFGASLRICVAFERKEGWGPWKVASCYLSGIGWAGVTSQGVYAWLGVPDVLAGVGCFLMGMLGMVLTYMAIDNAVTMINWLVSRATGKVPEDPKP